MRPLLSFVVALVLGGLPRAARADDSAPAPVVGAPPPVGPSLAGPPPAAPPQYSPGPPPYGAAPPYPAGPPPYGAPPYPAPPAYGAPPPPYPPLQYAPPLPPGDAPRAGGGVKLRFDVGALQRKLYDIPFLGGEARFGAGGSVGDARMYGFGGLLLAKDDTALSLREFTGGFLMEGSLGPVFLGGSIQLGVASVGARKTAAAAVGIGLAAHLGVDIAKTGAGGALFLLLRGTANAYDGRDARGPFLYGPTLAIGFRQ